MGASDKPEFPPLLPLGFHTLDLRTLRLICVQRFPLSVTRSMIMDDLERVVARLVAAGVVGKLWVNGSFMTEKIDPQDADILLEYPAPITDQRAGGVVYEFENVQSAHCHSFGLPRYPDGDPARATSEWMYGYWLRQFGFSRRDVPKGIAVIELPGR